ncbi:MAG: 2-phosphosulfolactate phosphatase [Parasphingorhabdus sp.]|jgi:2-phosphosulfolactate phosphatase
MPQTLHIIMNQKYLDSERLPGKTAVVFDVLLATTTIAMALNAGASEVYTVPEVEQARQLALQFNDQNSILAGEKDALVPQGFESFLPTQLATNPLDGKRLILVSTNGTVALHNALNASSILTCAIVNIGAVAEHLLTQHNSGTILLVCSASRHRFNIEDFLGAGLLVGRLNKLAPNRFNLTDSATAALHLAQTDNTEFILAQSRVGRVLADLDMHDDVILSGKLDHYNVAPKLVSGRLINASK